MIDLVLDAFRDRLLILWLTLMVLVFVALAAVCVALRAEVMGRGEVDGL